MEPKDTGNPMEDDGAGSKGRTPKIKIKIPKKVEDEATDIAVKSHFCKECNKSFSSGKALGGHMSSAHVQANKDYSFKKLRLSSKNKTPASGSYSGSDGGLMFPCTLCHKSFNTKKSLFGHMRCHPERYWRGMVPPPETPIADALSEDVGAGDGNGDDQIDSAGLGFNLKGWALSNKRGRVAIRAADEEEKENKSFELIKMLKGECSARIKPESEFKNNCREEKGKKKVAENQDSEELYNTAIQVLVSVKMGAAPEKYKCNVCGKLFQTLGRHRHSHTDCMSISNADSRSSQPIAKKKKTIDDDVSDADTAAAAASSAFAFDFDLNMAPEPEEDEEG